MADEEGRPEQEKSEENAAGLERVQDAINRFKHIQDEVKRGQDKLAEAQERLDAVMQRERHYYFETAKQITTLDTAALLILLAFQRQLFLTPWWRRVLER